MRIEVEIAKIEKRKVVLYVDEVPPQGFQDLAVGSDYTVGGVFEKAMGMWDKLASTEPYFQFVHLRNVKGD